MTVAETTRKLRAALRGPHVPILVVFVVFSLNCLTYRNVWKVGPLKLKWPIDTWQMYAAKAHVEPVVNYRRFLVETIDGGKHQTSFGEIAFLERAYRIDLGVSRDLPSFMRTVVHELSRRDPRITTFIYEARTWWYTKLSIDEHYVRDRPSFEYRARRIPYKPIVPPTDGNLVINGGFESLDPGSGIPRSWFIPTWSPFMGFAIDPLQNHAVLFGDRFEEAQVLRQMVTVAADRPRTVRMRAWACSRTAEAYVELHTGSPETRGNGARVPVRGDGTWHEVTTRLVLPAGATQVTVVLGGGPDVMFDDVALTLEP